jgi:hypothetical protein
MTLATTTANAAFRTKFDTQVVLNRLARRTEIKNNFVLSGVSEHAANLTLLSNGILIDQIGFALKFVDASLDFLELRSLGPTSPPSRAEKHPVRSRLQIPNTASQI